MSIRFSVESGDKKPWKRKRRRSSEFEERKYKEEERCKREKRDRGGPGSEETNDLRVNRGTWSSSCYRKDDMGRSQKNEEKTWSRVKTEREGILSNSSSLKRESGDSASGSSSKIKGETSKVRDTKLFLSHFLS